MRFSPRLAVAVSLLLPAPLALRDCAAQDAFDISVYPAATAGRGEWELETHLNYTARGTSARQTHLTFELTRGITDNWEVSAYLLTAHRPGFGAEYAGWRLRSRLHAPARWNLPIDLGFSTEFEVHEPAYGARAELELSPILEKRFGALRVGVNANFERDLGEGEVGGEEEGWEFEPSALVAYRLSSVATVRLEYHGAFGEILEPLAGPDQVHQFFPGVDLRLGEVTLGLAVGAGATTAGNRMVFASRLEFEF